MGIGIILLTLVLLCAAGWPLRAALQRLHVPPAVSLMALGVVVGPPLLDLLPKEWLEAGSLLSKAAFVVLLIRAGLGLSNDALKAIAVPALLLGTIPVAAELLAVFGLARGVLFDRADVAILAAFLIAAVSPAVILPTMLTQKDLGRSAARFVPDRIMGQTVVNAFIAQTGILLLVDAVCPASSGDGWEDQLAFVPLALLGGLAIGIVGGLGYRADAILGSRDLQPSAGKVRLFCIALIGGGLAAYFGCAQLGMESVFATLALGVMMRRRVDWCEPLLRGELAHFWRVAEIVLFANLGSQIELAKLADLGLVFLLLGIILAALAVRITIGFLLVQRTPLTTGERRYTAIAHLPKATIQAVFGAYPLKIFIERGDDPALREVGNTLLVMAVLAIVVTAPLGAVLLDRLGARYLEGD
ncbi:MAG: hypothetical protein CMJ83_13795 [Planctomycetes bacterium]|nr:hypothetical protein [Planctomycetota bacterium]